MSSIKNYLWDEIYGDETNSSGLTDMEEYELYTLFQKLQQNMKTREEFMEYFQPLWEDEK